MPQVWLSLRLSHKHKFDFNKEFVLVVWRYTSREILESCIFPGKIDMKTCVKPDCKLTCQALRHRTVLETAHRLAVSPLSEALKGWEPGRV